MAEIHSFPGAAAPDQAAGWQPQELVIARLRELLRRAEVGEIQGVAYAYVTDRETGAEGWTFPDELPMRLFYALGHTLSCLHNRYFSTATGGGKEILVPGPEPA